MDRGIVRMLCIFSVGLSYSLLAGLVEMQGPLERLERSDGWLRMYRLQRESSLAGRRLARRDLAI